MLARVPRGFIAAALAVGAVACRPAGPAAPKGPAQPAPRLLMTIVVDQLAAWEAAERWGALPADGGFARLRREGLTVRELRYEHANTDTASGHVALYTGAVARASGVFANEVIGPEGKPRSVLLDDRTRLVAGDGTRLDRPGSSLARLRVETLADVLVAAAPGARVYSFSLKDRAALPAAGRHPTAALWLDVPTEQLVTSTAFPAPPAWLAPLGSREALAGARASGWSLSDADKPWVEARAVTPDDQPGEGDLAGLGRVFPHAIGSAKAARATPVGDRVLLGLAKAALDEIAKERAPAPVLLALSLSSHDYVGHVFGPHSWEAWAELRELDRLLADLLAAADRAVGAEGYAVMLTSDHGAGTLPDVPADKRGLRCEPGAPADRWERPCAAARRVMPAAVVKALEAALVEAMGSGPWVAGMAEPFVTLAPRARELAAPARAKLVAAARRALAPLGVEDVVDVPAAAADCPAGDSREAVICNAIDPSAPADLLLIDAQGAFFDPDVVLGFGASHGSRFLYDRAVPLLVRAPGRVAAGAVREEPVSYRAFARTAAALLGIRPPAGAREGQDLSRE